MKLIISQQTCEINTRSETQVNLDLNWNFVFRLRPGLKLKYIPSYNHLKPHAYLLTITIISNLVLTYLQL